MPLLLVREDITRMQVDAIVNAANTNLAQGGGVCGAIFSAAGEQQMGKACAALAPIRTGEAVVTPGFALTARWVMHAAGPVYLQHTPEQAEQLLRSAYVSSLQQAAALGCESIAFPLISSGIYGYPKAQALAVAQDAIAQFLRGQQEEMDVYLAVFDREAFQLSQELLGEVASFVDQHYVDQTERDFSRAGRREKILYVLDSFAEYQKPDPDFGNWPLEESFDVYLLQLIRQLGLSEVDVYKQANISRKLFSKIRTGNGYLPSKRTVLALAIGMRLDLEQTGELLQHAGYALASNQLFDVIIKFFIQRRRYDVHAINAVLFQHDQQLLGS